MSLRRILTAHARIVARVRARRWAGWTALWGALAVAVGLFAERAGFDVPFLQLPGLPSAGPADRFLWFLAVSFAGLLQGIALLIGVFAVAAVISVAGRQFRPSPSWTAGALDRVLTTDRFSAAREAAGPFAALVVRSAVAPPPPPQTLASKKRPGPPRWLILLAVLLVFAVALLPGAAPGEEGWAPVAGAPEPGRDEVALRLELTGPEKPTRGSEPVWLEVTATAERAPADDVSLLLEAGVDGDAFSPVGVTLFLPAGAPGAESGRFDLRPWLEGLAPGKHRVVVRGGALRSNEYVFEIEPPPGGKKPKPKPQPKSPRSDPPPPPQPKPKRKKQPREIVPKYVKPLVRDGDKVQKNAKVPIEVPEGGPPRPRPLDQAWPELQRRREAALRRRGLSPDTRRLVHAYFENLRPKDK